MLAGTVSRLRFCRRSWGLKIHFGWNIVRFGKPYICSNKLDVQETNFSFAQFDRIRNHLFGRWIEIRRDSCSRFMEIWLFQFLETRFRLLKDRWDPLSMTKIKNLKEWPTCWITLIVLPQTSSLRIKKLCCMCLKTTKQWSRWSPREGVPQWDMFPGHTELRLIGWSIESTWTPKIQIKYIDTKNQLADILTKGNFTRDERNHFVCLFNISHFTSTNCSEVMSKRTQKDAGEERVTAKSEPMMNLFSRCSERNPDVFASTASESWGKPDMKVNYLWALKLRSTIERRDPF